MLQFGQRTDVFLPTDRETGRPRVGFVRFSSAQEAEAAIAEMDGANSAAAPSASTSRSGAARRRRRRRLWRWWRRRLWRRWWLRDRGGGGY